MTNEVYDQVQKRKWPATRHMSLRTLNERRTAMRAVLKRYTTAGHLNIEVDIKEMGSVDRRLPMRGLWSFRSGKPDEQTRLIGVFARPGAFVATSFRARGELDGDDEVSGSQKWLAEKSLAEAEWRRIFPGYPYLSGPWPVMNGIDLAHYLERSDA